MRQSFQSQRPPSRRIQSSQPSTSHHQQKRPRTINNENTRVVSRNGDDEAALMAELLAGIDASVFDAPPSSQSPMKDSSQKSRSPFSQSRRQSQPSPEPLAHHSKRTVHAEKRSASLQKAEARSASSGYTKYERHSPNPIVDQRNSSHGLITPEPPPSPPLRYETGLAAQRISTSDRGVMSFNRPLDLNALSTVPLPTISVEGPAQAAYKAQQDPAPPVVDLEDVCVPPQPATQESDYDMDWDLDALANVDESELVTAAAPLIKYPIQNPPVPAIPNGYKKAAWVRCVVDGVYPGLLDEVPNEVDESASDQHGKTLVARLSPDDTTRLIHLKERWADLYIRIGDTINIISPSLTLDERTPIVVTFSDPSTYLVHHPDLLVTMTSIAGAIPCPRRPLVQQLVRLPEPPSKHMLYGNVLHSLLQGSLSEQAFDRASTSRRITTQLSREDCRLEVWGAGLNTDSVTDDLGPRAESGFESFGRKWVGGTISGDGQVMTAREEQIGTMAITGLHEIEEDIWSPKWGLKGKVDASVQIRLRRDGARDEEELVAPLEIKTGKSLGGVTHRAQTMLYTLLMEDRYAGPVPSGLLYYSQRDTIILVDARANEIRALIMARNEIAEWMARERVAPNLRPEPEGVCASQDIVMEPSFDSVDSLDATASQVLSDVSVPFMPPTIDLPNECSRCYANDACMLYRRAVDRTPASEEDAIADVYNNKVGHMSDSDADFFRHWEHLLTLEEQDTVRLRAQLWTMTSKAREKSGRCFANMMITSESNDVGKSLSKIHRYAYTFKRAPETDGSESLASLLAGHIASGDPVSLSIEPDLLCLSRGFVTSLTRESVTVSVTYKIDIDSLMARCRREKPDPVTFRIDKDELSSGMIRMRGNLAELFIGGRDEKRRRLIVDLAEPSYDETEAPTTEEYPKSLNADQRAVMHKVLTAQDYALILGMPGTGKTTTVAEIIKAIVARGKTVLLTSYTHSAVDTIVSKLLNADFQVLRIGNADKVHRDVQHLTLDAMGPSTSSEQLEARLMDPPVVAATCLSIEHPLFFRRKFDYCIVDEASQITLPTCLGPLRCADKFVLVGDHFQLPPIVRKAEARAGGLDVSLFRRLSDEHPQSVAPLAAQYRMNEDIMELSNHLIYENRLRCGSELIARQSLTLRDRKSCREIEPSSTCGDDCWVQTVLHEDVKAVFVDTDALPARDSRAGDLVQNVTEAELVYQLVRAMTASGIRQHDVCVITPYRQQIKLLSSLLNGDMDDVEILTADKSQGRDKDVVLISLVRSNEDGRIGDLLRDWRRINVSFTRAKKKLVIFGSRSTLENDKLLKDFFSLMERKNWILKLPQSAESMHGPHKAGVVDAEESLKRARKAVVGERLLHNKPFIKDILTGMDN